LAQLIDPAQWQYWRDRHLSHELDQDVQAEWLSISVTERGL
jgi:DNA polymerase IIIc chi subunit